MGKAIAYNLDQWDKITTYLESPYLTPNNNTCENAIRPFVLGRKNWLFCQSPKGAESYCGIYTLIETAKQNGLVPVAYLTAFLKKYRSLSHPRTGKNSFPGTFLLLKLTDTDFLDIIPLIA